MTTQGISKAWTFVSERNGGPLYQTLQYADGTTSCDCFGWTRRVQKMADGSTRRSCKHTRMVDMQTADLYATAKQGYAMGQKAASVSPSGKLQPTTTILKSVKRRIRFDD